MNGVNGSAPAFEEVLLGQLLASGNLHLDGAERARRAFERAGGSIVDILIKLALCAEKDLAKGVANASRWPLLDSANIPETPISTASLNPRFLREAQLLPLAEDDESITVAATDPANPFTLQALRLALGKPVNFVVGTPSEIEAALVRLYGIDGASEAERNAGELARAVTDADLVRLRESASEAPIVRLVDRLIARAVEMGASDIHLEPLERVLRIRTRVDGVLREEDPAPLAEAPAIVSRVKILARLDIAERRLPQDGAFKMNVRGRETDFRVATAPVAFGESVAIRILDSSNVSLDLATLGFTPAVLAAIETILVRPNGIFLVTGPTGSGKSTTLYAALTRLNDPSRKIITVEDPVEYKIEGLNQIQVKPDIGFDFARALRSILRHDPDVIMVGEIRDAETARIAVQAALTGHLVVATLHTNDAPSAVTRLMDMGIEDYLITSTVAGVLAQRLVRMLCPACRVPVRLETDGHAVDAFEAGGCSDCAKTGYRGRSVIAELMPFDEALRRRVLARAAASELRASAITNGMVTLYEDGLGRVADGTTSYEEVVRVAQDLS